MQKDLLRFKDDSKFLFFDYETYNLNLNIRNQLNFVWQAAFISRHGKEVEEYDFLVNYENDTHDIGEAADRITGYSRRRVARYDNRTPKQEREQFGTDFEEFFVKQKELIDWCDYLVGHNTIGFDIPLLFSMYDIMGESTDGIMDKVIDTNCIARASLSGKKKQDSSSLIEFQMKVYNCRMKGIRSSLGLLAKNYKIEHDYENLHDALVDLQLNAKVWDKLKFELDI